MSQNEQKRSNETHNQQQRRGFIYSEEVYLIGHFGDEFNFLSIYKSSR